MKFLFILAKSLCWLYAVMAVIAILGALTYLSVEHPWVRIVEAAIAASCMVSWPIWYVNTHDRDGEQKVSPRFHDEQW